MKYKKSVLRSLSLVTQLGPSVVTPIFLCIFAGSCIDSRFETETVVPFPIVGTLADGRYVYVLMKKMIATKAKDGEKARAEVLEEAKEHPMSIVMKPKQPSHVQTNRDETDRENGNV